MWFLCSVYIAEIAPQNMRGALGSVNQLFFGLQLSVTTGMTLASLFGLNASWRFLVVLDISDASSNAATLGLGAIQVLATVVTTSYLNGVISLRPHFIFPVLA